MVELLDEYTINAIVEEITWLMQGQPVTSVDEKKLDMYNRPLIVVQSHQTPMSYRAAYAVAYERAKMWSFQAPTAPKKPIGFIPWDDTAGELTYGAKEPETNLPDDINPRIDSPTDSQRGWPDTEPKSRIDSPLSHPEFRDADSPPDTERRGTV